VVHKLASESAEMELDIWVVAKYSSGKDLVTAIKFAKEFDKFRAMEERKPGVEFGKAQF